MLIGGEKNGIRLQGELVENIIELMSELNVLNAAFFESLLTQLLVAIRV